MEAQRIIRCKQENIDYLLEKLKEEKQATFLAKKDADAAKNEVKILREMLEPLQRKELARISREREANIKKYNNNVKEDNFRREQIASKPRGRIVCDCGDFDHCV